VGFKVLIGLRILGRDNCADDISEKIIRNNCTGTSYVCKMLFIVLHDLQEKKADLH